MITSLTVCLRKVSRCHIEIVFSKVQAEKLLQSILQVSFSFYELLSFQFITLSFYTDFIFRYSPFLFISKKGDNFKLCHSCKKKGVTRVGVHGEKLIIWMQRVYVKRMLMTKVGVYGRKKDKNEFIKRH